MPLQGAVEIYKTQETRRRELAKLRVTYGNALSDSNLGRTSSRSHPLPRSGSNSITTGRAANAYSWQVSNTRLYPKVYDGDDESYSILRRYEKLQSQARRLAMTMKNRKCAS